MCQIVDIKTACSHIGSHKELSRVLAKFLHRIVALGLREVAVQAVGIIAVGYQLVGHILRILASATEDDAVDVGVMVSHALQSMVFVLSLDQIIDMLHILRTLIALSGDKLHRIVHEVLGDSRDLLRHSG